jgi:hypothetical protein
VKPVHAWKHTATALTTDSTAAAAAAAAAAGAGDAAAVLLVVLLLPLLLLPLLVLLVLKKPPPLAPLKLPFVLVLGCCCHWLSLSPERPLARRWLRLLRLGDMPAVVATEVTSFHCLVEAEAVAERPLRPSLRLLSSEAG